MSFEYYTNWWIVSKQHLEDLYAKDALFRKKAKAVSDRHLANELLGGLYAKYSLLVQEIDACLDQMAQPQKRVSVRKLMDAATIRLYEMSQLLKDIDFSEYHYIDGTLVELKLVPYDVEILSPAIFYNRPIEIEDMWKKLQKGEKIYTLPEPTVEIEEVEDPEKAVHFAEEEQKAAKLKKRPKKHQSDEKLLTPEEIEENRRKEIILERIKLIQVAERARQERVYFQIKNLIFQRRKAAKLLGANPPETDKEVQNKAAQVMQKVWRGYSAREELRAKEIERRLLIGMYEPSWKSRYEFEVFNKNLQVRRDYRDQRIREYIEGIDQEKARILRVMAPGLAEDIGDEIREWFRIWYLGAKTFDKYPPEEKGGTILVIRGETMTPKEYLDEYERKRRAKVKGKGVDKEKQKAKLEKKKKAEEEKKKKAAEKKKKADEAKRKKQKQKQGIYDLEYNDTAMVVPYQQGLEEHREIWDKRNDFDNPLEKHYMDIITDQKCYEVQLEVRKNVDELMRLELELLVDALAEDKARAKGKKRKAKKAKKKKNKKKKGKKGKKDITGFRTTEDLFQELYDCGIIRTYPTVHLDEYHGDFSYQNWEQREMDFDPPPTLLDVRQAVVMNCIMPLGVESMKKPRSVLIAGPRQSGKHLLANAVFTETQCVLFDLSPEITVGKYPGAKGMKMLLHLVSKMSKLLAPSVIYIDGAERVFYKKVPKEEKELDPKRIGKKLFKGIVKTITPADRVQVLSITGKPWAGQAAKLKKTFERIILIPRPDYGSIYLYWRELLMPYPGIDRNFNVTALAKMTVYYPYSTLRDVVKQVMVPRRKIQLKYNPVTPAEFYEVMVSKGLEPITEKEYKKFVKWYNKTSLGKLRNRFNKLANIQREATAKKNQKAKEMKNLNNFDDAEFD